MNDITLNVQGMSCGGCENTVRTVVGAAKNVGAVEADHTTGRVAITATGPVDLDEIKASIAEAGFEVVD